MTNINELTIDQLLELATTEGKSNSNLMNDKSNVRNFIREYSVKDGDTLVPNYLVYYVYSKKWRPQGNKISKIGFMRKFSVAFNSTRKTKVRYYLLDPEVFDLSEESLFIAKDFDIRMRTKIKKKGNHGRKEKEE